MKEEREHLIDACNEAISMYREISDDSLTDTEIVEFFTAVVNGKELPYRIEDNTAPAPGSDESRRRIEVDKQEIVDAIYAALDDEQEITEGELREQYPDNCFVKQGIYLACSLGEFNIVGYRDSGLIIGQY